MHGLTHAYPFRQSFIKLISHKCASTSYKLGILSMIAEAEGTGEEKTEMVDWVEHFCFKQKTAYEVLA